MIADATNSEAIFSQACYRGSGAAAHLSPVSAGIRELPLSPSRQAKKHPDKRRLIRGAASGVSSRSAGLSGMTKTRRFQPFAGPKSSGRVRPQGNLGARSVPTGLRSTQALEQLTHPGQPLLPGHSRDPRLDAVLCQENRRIQISSTSTPTGMASAEHRRPTRAVGAPLRRWVNEASSYEQLVGPRE